MSKIYEVADVGEGNRSDNYINAERARVAAEQGVDIERVQTQRGIKERTAAGIKRAGRYLAQIQQIFIERGLPPELTFLPIVESSYDINARSSVGALASGSLCLEPEDNIFASAGALTNEGTRWNRPAPPPPILKKLTKF